MTDRNSHEDLDPEQTDRLLDASAHGDAPAGDPLAALLMAAASGPQDHPLPGEEQFLAQYREAQPPAAKISRIRRPARAAVGAALIALSLGGIAVAAEIIHPSSNQQEHPTGPNTTTQSSTTIGTSPARSTSEITTHPEQLTGSRQPPRAPESDQQDASHHQETPAKYQKKKAQGKKVTSDPHLPAKPINTARSSRTPGQSRTRK
ncbi:hypothetical protein FNH05_31345 [Amycolatopsis rhizosphaerae]|uniref:Uncharacterized protein n=1 Tax=Amycolatopsis rhizosphaerae TaxID=2053003 RepID=A0A558AQH2_9PSEU|nr:hypothetical protein [Amycolatopsis rhizosphaerae]TVT26497.1 hypothetical protein FNH05_31345 [Amycolatopsis rhizosphaerae]